MPERRGVVMSPILPRIDAARVQARQNLFFGEVLLLLGRYPDDSEDNDNSNDDDNFSADDDCCWETAAAGTTTTTTGATTGATPTTPGEKGALGLALNRGRFG